MVGGAVRRHGDPWREGPPGQLGGPQGKFLGVGRVVGGPRENKVSLRWPWTLGWGGAVGLRVWIRGGGLPAGGRPWGRGVSQAQLAGGGGDCGICEAPEEGWGCWGRAVRSLAGPPCQPQAAGADASSRGRTGTARPNLKPWREEPAAKTGREASAMRAGHCSASFRCPRGVPMAATGQGWQSALTQR